MVHAQFLLKIERGGKPSTFNHYFNSNLQKQRNKRLAGPLEALSIKRQEIVRASMEGGSWPSKPALFENDRYVSVSHIGRAISDKSNTQQICEDILDTLTSYYKVSRKRFVDVICQQVVNHFLLESEEGPLHTFSPDLVMGLDEDQLDAIASEEDMAKERRCVLQREIENLEQALKILRRS